VGSVSDNGLEGVALGMHRMNPRYFDAEFPYSSAAGNIHLREESDEEDEEEEEGDGVGEDEDGDGDGDDGYSE